MTVPTTFQFAAIRVPDPDNPSNKITICGVQTTGLNSTVQTTSKALRDCDQPAKPAQQRITVQSFSRQLTGSGLYNVDQTELINSLLANPTTYDYVMLDISDPDIPAGTELGTWSGPGVATAINMATTENSDATISITVDSNGEWTYTPAS